jgi:hypothetical protein
MNRQITKLAILGMTVVAIGLLLSIPLLAVEKQYAHGDHPAPTAGSVPGKRCSMQDEHPCIRGKHQSMQKMCAARLDQVIKAIDAATKAVEGGRKVVALAELKKARGVVALCRETMLDMGKRRIANARCPIMGTKLDPEKVSPDLTRRYMGRKVGFCCAGCPQQWDKLSSAEKDERLEKVVPPKPVHEPDGENKHLHDH